MRIAIAVVALSFFPLSPVRAAFTDFSDYTQRRSFAAGEAFSSNGLHFRAVEFRPISNPVWMNASKTYAELLVGPGVEFLLPFGIEEVSFKFGDGAGIRIAVNGVQPVLYPGQANIPYHAGFSFLNGKSLGGVEISTDIDARTDSIGYQQGVLTLRGPIQSLVIAGLELTIDDVSVIVPEPNAAALLVLGVVGATFHRQRRRL